MTMPRLIVLALTVALLFALAMAVASAQDAPEHDWITGAYGYSCCTPGQHFTSIEG